jgi:hypothetical protein
VEQKLALRNAAHENILNAEALAEVYDTDAPLLIQNGLHLLVNENDAVSVHCHFRDLNISA